MALISEKPKKKKDRKPIYILLFLLVFFGLFIYILIKPSAQSKALKEIETSFNKKDVQMVFYKYKGDLSSSNENGTTTIDEDFLFSVRTKLAGLKLSDEEIEDCKSWLPPPPENINLIIIPDLSRRIIDTLNNPNQIENDKLVLNIIWEAFEKYSRLKSDSKDLLMVDVTDMDQAKGQFGTIANQLRFDLSSHQNKSNRLYFDSSKTNQFNEGVNELYASAKSKPLGADYRFYFRRYLGERLKKSSLFENYKNKIVIITDGYLEAEGKTADTRLKGFKPLLDKAVLNGNVLDIIKQNSLVIPKENVDLTNAEVLVCEVREREYQPFTKIKYPGKGYDYDILKNYWVDWLARMGAKKPMFIAQELSSDITKKNIIDFIER